MAMRVELPVAGIDVSKDSLAICVGADGQVEVIENNRRSIRRWLRQLGGQWRLAIEATNTFHLDVLTLAYEQGHEVYLLDGYRLNRYRDALNGRAKTDATDAVLLRRYLTREHEDLRPWTPPPAGYDRVFRLLRRRAKIVRCRGALEQSLADLPLGRRSVKDLLRRLKRVEQTIETALQQDIEALGWRDDQARCQQIEGIGKLTAAALAIVFQRGPFVSSDAFVAFFGMDVRIRDSGKLTGRRKLTKKGNPELRRLIYLAAMAAARSKTWKPTYQRFRDRGMKPTQAYVALARKLIRVAFALMKNQSQYQPRAVAMA